MEKLKESFNRQNLRYTLLKRDEQLAIFGISGTFNYNILHYEVVMVRIRDDQYGHRESVPSDEEFGKTKPDRHFQKIVEALTYFDEWTARLMQGVREKDEKVVTHQQIEKPSLLY